MEEDLLHFRIVSIEQETAEARIYELSEVNGRLAHFKPGQFLTFIIDTGKQEVRRSYSILSLPGEALQVLVKKVDNGLISRYILANWKEGDIVTTLLPAGRFTVKPQHIISRDIFCFAAGSGIAPILPQIRRLVMEEPQSAIHLIYSNTNEKSALFLPDLEEMQVRYPEFRLIELFSDPVERLKERARLSNLLTQDLVTRHLKYDKKDAVFLICGPFTYMRMLGITLISMHFRKENLYKENFLPEIMRSGYISHPVYPARTVEIQLKGKKYPVLVRSGQDILSAALQNGLRPPYSCQGGVCGNCAALCKEGKVEMSINEVLTNEDLKQGWVLTCTGYPAKEDTVIVFP